MAITLRKQVAPDWWRYDKEDAASPEFYTKPLSSIDYVGCRAELGENAFGRPSITARGVRLALSGGLLNWRGVTDESGNEVAFSRDAMERLPPDVLANIAWRILSISYLSEEQKKS